MILIEARKINQGKCFRKATGEYVYLRISESAIRYLGLDTEKIYGVCFNGNIAVVHPLTRVIAMPTSGMDENRRKEKEWHILVGAKLEDEDYPG